MNIDERIQALQEELQELEERQRGALLVAQRQIDELARTEGIGRWTSEFMLQYRCALQEILKGYAESMTL